MKFLPGNFPIKTGLCKALLILFTKPLFKFSADQAYRHSDYGQDNANNPESHCHFIMGPAFGFKMMVNRRAKPDFFLSEFL